MPVDISRHLGATSRTVSDVSRDGKPAKAVIASRTYDTTPDDLWNALTTAERIPRWFLPIEGDLKMGGRYKFTGSAGGQITRCDAPTHLAVTWEYGTEVSWIDVVLSENPAGGTKLELTHVAYVSDDRWNQFGPGAVGVGWEMALMGLGEHFSAKPALVPADGVAWQGSEEGKAFARGSSEGWRIASIASGTPEQAATDAANRTSAFYTGEG